MKCEVRNDLLRVTPPGGRSVDLDFGSIKVGPELRKALLARFVELAGPSGSWAAQRTLAEATITVRAFFAHLDVIGAADLTGFMYRERLLAWSPSVRHQRHAILKSVLLPLDGITPHCVEVIQSMMVPRPPRKSLNAALTDEEVEALRLICFETVRDATIRVNRGWAVVERFQRNYYHEGHQDLKYATVLDEIARTGDVAHRVSGRRQLPRRVLEKLYSEGVNQNVSPFPLWEHLFPTPEEMSAAVLGLVITCGWNLSVAMRLSIGDIDRVDARDDSEPTHLRVKLGKPRRGAVSNWTETYTDNSPRSKARLLLMVLEMTEGTRRTLRSAGYPTDSVLTCLSSGLNSISQSPRPLPFTVLADASVYTVMKYLARWRADHPDLDFATPQQLRSFFATRVHPQGHSLDTNIDYNLKDPTVKLAVQPVIAAALEEHLQNMRARVFRSEAAATTDLPEYTADVVDEVNSGARDTVAAACVDHEHAPDSQQRCGASFLTCFGCTNAVILKRHLPRVVALYEHLNMLRAVTPPNVWAARFAVHHSRIDSLLVPGEYFAANDLRDARDKITGMDRDRVKRLMDGGWDI